MEESVAPQAQIPELKMPQAAKEAEPLQKPSESQETQKPLENLDLPEAWECEEFPEVGLPQNLRDPQELPGWKPPAAQEHQEMPIVQDTQKPLEPLAAPESLGLPVIHEPPVPSLVCELSAA